jgi:hypothetical protein
MTKVINFSKQNCERVDHVSRSFGFSGLCSSFARRQNIQRPKVSLRLVGIELNPGPLHKKLKNNNAVKTANKISATGPAQIMSNITFGHKYRFRSTSGSVTAITPTSLLCAAGTIGTVTNTTVTSFFSSVRVTRVQIWAPVASQGAVATCSVLWAGSVSPFFQDREISDTSVSVTKPAFIDATPPRKSLAAFWQTASTAVLFSLTAPTGAIIDVTVALTLSDDDTSSATSTVATAVVGTVYYLSLDPNATHLYIPVSLTTTT